MKKDLLSASLAIALATSLQASPSADNLVLINANSAAISENTAAITALDTRVQSTESTTASNSGAINANAASIGLLDTRVQSTESATASNSGAINANAASIGLLDDEATNAANAISVLEGRLDTAESLIAAQAAALESINAHLATLDSQVAQLQSYHMLREFTVTDVANVDDFTPTELGDNITALNFKDGEWLYIKVEGDLFGSTVNTTELCTSDSRLTTTVFNEYFQSSVNGYYFSEFGDQNLTYVKSDVSPEGSNWGAADTIAAQAQNFYRINIWAWSGNVYFDTNIFPGHTTLYREILTPYGGSDVTIDRSVTFKAGATRQEACGF